MRELFKSEALRVTPLVAYGGVFMFAILSYFGIARLSEQVALKRSDVSSLTDQLLVLKSLEDADLWQVRLDESLLLREARAKNVWTDETYSLVGARLQSTLRTLGQSHNLTNLKVAVDPEASSFGDAEILRFSISNNGAEAADLLGMIYSVSSYPVRINLDDVNLSLNLGAKSNLRLSGHIPVLLSDGGQVQP